MTDFARTLATLCAHAGSEIVTRHQLAQIKPPAATATHMPVSHGELIEVLESELWRSQIRIESEQYSVMTQGMKMFGVMKLSAYAQTVQGVRIEKNHSFSMALGIRASNDKKFPVELIAGMNIFVCDNLAFNGEIIALRRRHTSRLDIRYELAEGVRRALGGFRDLGAKVEVWKGQGLSQDRAKGLILDAGVGVPPIMPLHLIPDVLQEWNHPKHPEFEPRTVWSLHNAFTSAFKKLKPHVAMESARRLDGLLMTAGGVQ